MMTLDNVKYAVHCYLDKAKIQHYFHGAFKLNNAHSCLLFVLHGHVSFDDVGLLTRYKPIRFVSVLDSEDFDITYLEVCYE